MIEDAKGRDAAIEDGESAAGDLLSGEAVTLPERRSSPAAWDVVPIFKCIERTPPTQPEVVGFSGTGFRLGPDLLITCWHCVADDVPYAVAFPVEDGGYRMHPLTDLEQDVNGSDLASARIFDGAAVPRELDLRLAAGPALGSADVWTYGYPFTDEFATDEGGWRFTLNPRFLQGYVTRAFYYEHDRYGRTPTYELDMPAPEGLSGAPLVRRPSTEVIGVIYGRTETTAVDAFASVDPETGERRPEIERVVWFAAAHYTDTLHDMRGRATGGKRLVDFLAERE